MPRLLGEGEATAKFSEELVKKNRFFTIQNKFDREYLVLADDADQGGAAILATTGVPQLLTQLGNAWCVGRFPSEVASVTHPTSGLSTILWSVACHWDSDIDVEEADQAPESRTPKVRWFGRSENEELKEDAVNFQANGDPEPIVNKVGEVIGTEAPVSRAILEIRRFEVPPFDPTIIFDYMNHVNSIAFYGAPIGTALMTDIDASEVQVVDKVRVVEVTYRIKFKMKKDNLDVFIADTYKFRPLHQGTLEFADDAAVAAGNSVASLDDAGNPITVNLDVVGKRLAAGVDKVYLEFNRFPLNNFNVLNLGPF